MRRALRSISVMLAAPLLAAAFLVAPTAQGWSMGSNNYWYSNNGSWKTTIPAKYQRIASGQDWVTSAVSECIAHEFQYRRYNTLAPTSLLISNPMTDYDKRICGDRTNNRWLGEQGTPKVFGRFRAPGDPGIVKNWIDG